MRGYAIVSTNDDAGEEWVSVENALSHVSAVENPPRANSKIPHRMHAQVMDAEAAVCIALAKLSQNRPGLNLSDIIEIVAHRHSTGPLASAFAKLTSKGGGGKAANGHRNGDIEAM